MSWGDILKRTKRLSKKRLWEIEERLKESWDEYTGRPGATREELLEEFPPSRFSNINGDAVKLYRIATDMEYYDRSLKSIIKELHGHIMLGNMGRKRDD
tara:strand:- start:41 stop:337 length:297 start_codon:yes stop_codon:yes gene_type:complete